MNLKLYHYTHFKCISYDITFDVGHREILDLLMPPKMSLSFYIDFELPCEKLTSFVNKLFVNI